MAGKHMGTAAYVDGLTHPAKGPYSKEAIAWREGVTGNPASNPHPEGTPAHDAYDAGAAANNYHEAAPGGSTS